MVRESLKMGIMSRKDYKARTIAIARGTYKPGKEEPKIWFESLRSLAQILSEENRELLRIIEEQKPESLSQLAETTGRKRSNLSRTLKTMAEYGIVDLVKKNGSVRPRVKATSFQVEFGLIRERSIEP